MRRIISALLVGVTLALGPAQADEAIALAGNAPDRHIVVPGDTLWGIAGRFLQQPWRWPQLWGMNREQIRNPHWIYPGDVIVLDRSGATPRLRLARQVGRDRPRPASTPGTVRLTPQIYSEDSQTAISSIPPHAIEPFISRPLVVEEGELENTPRITAVQEDRVFLGNGDRFFVSGITSDSQRDWHVYRKARPLTDPETQTVLGHEAYYLGTARLVEVGDEVTTFEVTTLKEEIGRGDLLVPAPLPTLMAYVPHQPESQIDGRVMSLYGSNLREVGKYAIIALNRGERDGLERGHVLSLKRVRLDRSRDEQGKAQAAVPLPEETYGLVFVFRVFPRIAYALVMHSSRPVQINDRVATP